MGCHFDRQVYGLELKVASTRSRPISDTHRDETAAAKLTVAPAQPAPHELQRDITRYVVPARQGDLDLEHGFPGGVGLHPFVGRGGAGDVAAQLC